MTDAQAPARSLLEIPSLPNLPLIASLPWIHHREGFMARMLELAEQHRDIGMFRVPLPGKHTPIFIGNVSLAADHRGGLEYRHPG